MELGKIQKLWIKQLKAHPERQLKISLFEGDSKNYQACCLGELLLCKYRIEKKKFPIIDGMLLEEDVNNELLKKSWNELGLYSDNGMNNKANSKYSLAYLNDKESSWIAIAELVEANPSMYFSKSI